MKTTIPLIVFLVLFCLCGFLIVHADDKANKGPRMAFLGEQALDTDSGQRMHVKFLHDNETQQEVVCVEYSTSAPSCYLTGRKW